MITLIRIGPVHCTKCQTPLGHIVDYKSKAYFFDGLALVLIGLRRCPCCGVAFFWSGEAVKLEDAIIRYGKENGKPVSAINETCKNH